MPYVAGGPVVFLACSQGYGFFLTSCIRIRIRVKCWLWIRIVKIQELKRFKTKPWRAVDVHNGCVEAQNGPVIGSSHHFDENADPHYSGESGPAPH